MREIYYAVTDEAHSVDNPSGLVRRRSAEEGGFADETLQKDLTWAPTSAIVEWKRDALDFQLVEIDEAKAAELIARFREKWSSQG